MALDIGGKHASGTVSGLSDAAGYGGAILSGYTIGILAERFGWNTAFLGLCAIALLGLFSAICYWRLNERLLNAPGDSATTNTQPEN
jgi:sugar phosphate permease